MTHGFGAAAAFRFNLRLRLSLPCGSEALRCSDIFTVPSWPQAPSHGRGPRGGRASDRRSDRRRGAGSDSSSKAAVTDRDS